MADIRWLFDNKIAIFCVFNIKYNGGGNIKKAGKINVLNDDSALLWA